MKYIQTKVSFLYHNFYCLFYEQDYSGLENKEHYAP